MIHALRIDTFRNLDVIDLREVRNGLIALTGSNGAGKTNLLEAVSLLAPGRGLRRASVAEMAAQGDAGAFTVGATLTGRDGGTAELGTAVLAAQPGRRIVRINGAPQPANSLAEWLSVLWLTPAMDRLFVEPAAGRRRFLDRLVLAIDPRHAAHASRYEAAMRARNRLLAAEAPADPVWLDALESQMAGYGAALHDARAKLVAELSRRLAGESAGPFARPAIALAGNDWTEERLSIALRSGRQRDAATGRALAGPHRSDLVVRHAAKDRDAASSSTGEQKAMLLSLILTHADMVATLHPAVPRLLLLDEVAAHLDVSRRAALFARLADSGAQVWMTGTDRDMFSGAGAQHITVDDGHVIR